MGVLVFEDSGLFPPSQRRSDVLLDENEEWFGRDLGGDEERLRVEMGEGVGVGSEAIFITMRLSYCLLRLYAKGLDAWLVEHVEHKTIEKRSRLNCSNSLMPSQPKTAFKDSNDYISEKYKRAKEEH